MPHGKRKIRSSPRSLVHGAVSTEVLHGMGSRSIGCMEVHSEDGMTFFFAGSGLFSSSRSGTVGLVAGHESDVGFVDGCRTEARFDHPCGMVLDPTFQCMYVSDTNNHALRRVMLTTGKVETVVGGAEGVPGFVNGVGSDARLNFPWGIAMDRHGVIFVADQSNHCLRRVELQGVHREAFITTFVGGVRDGFRDGPGDQALFSFPNGIAIDHDGNLIVADYCNNRIRKVFLNSEARKVSTVGGNDSSGAYDDDDWCRDGPFALSRFNGPKDVVVDCHNNIVVADAGNHIVRTIRHCGVVRTIAGSTELLANGGDVEVPQDTMDGKGASVRFNGPCSMLFDHDGTLLVLDNDNATCVRRVKYPT